MKMKSLKPSSLFRGSPAVFAALAVVGFACAPSVPLQHRPCPCADGWVCCPSSDVCAATASSCPGAQSAGTSGAAGTTSGMAGAAGTAASGSCANDSADAGLPALPDPAYTIQPALLGTWSGYFENFALPSNSDAVRLSLTQNPDGTGKVSVMLGMGTPPAPPTDPTQTWPPNVPLPGTDGAAGASGQPSHYFEGFAYDAHEVQWSAGRLKFVINDEEPWQPWCQLQTSYYVKSGATYRCIPGDVGGGAGPGDTYFPANFSGSCVALGEKGVDTPSEQPVSCMQAFGCGENGGNFCACDCAGCTARVDVTTSFDITFTGAMAVGNVTINLGHTPDTGHDVMLTQAAPADGGQP